MGETAFLVVKAQFLPRNDTFTLYTNPVIGNAEPVAGVTKTDLDLGNVSAISVLSTGSFAIDEIRMGTTYAEVTPAAAVPEPNASILLMSAVSALLTTQLGRRQRSRSTTESQ